MSLLGRKITAFLKKVTDLPDRPSPTYSASEIKAQFDSSPEELRVALNGLIDDLASSSPGASGTDQVGAAPIPGLTGTTAYTQLVAIKALLDSSANQNAFSNIAVPGQSIVAADTATDTLTLTGGTGIAITTNQGTDTVTITATGSSTPGAHAATHITGGSDIIPNAVAGGNAGLMSGADKAKSDSHASTHVTGGADVIPNAVAGGNAGLMSGTDKSRLDAAYASGGIPVSTNGRVSNLLITTVTANNLTVYPVGAAAANFMVLVYYNVVTGPINVTVDVVYTDSSGAQTNTLLLGQLSPVGSYSLLPLFINASAGTNITVKFTSSIANRARVSCTILGV